MTNLGTAIENEGKPLKFWFDINVVKEASALGSQSQSSITEDDKTITSSTSSSSVEIAYLYPLLNYSTSLGAADVSFSYSSSNAAEIEVDSFGVVSSLVEESASTTITIVAAKGTDTVTRALIVNLDVSGGITTEVIEGGVSGTAREALTTTIDTSLSGASTSLQQSLFSTENHASQNYTRNSSLILNASHLDALTCESPWNSSGGTKKAGTLVTPRHVVLANHYRYGNGTTVRFVGTDGTVFNRTVIQGKRVDNGANPTDVYIALLNEDLPNDITPCEIFPSNYATYLPSGNNSAAANSLPIIALNQENKVVLLDFNYVYDSSGSYNRALFSVPVKTDRLAFNKTIIAGDSGSPLFAVNDTKLLLVSTFTTPKAGPFYGDLTSALNSTIAEVDALAGISTGYTVTEGDLSSYTVY